MGNKLKKAEKVVGSLQTKTSFEQRISKAARIINVISLLVLVGSVAVFSLLKFTLTKVLIYTVLLTLGTYFTLVIISTILCIFTNVFKN